jgi:cellulose synthase/poly-beta-1,6-N-acetylglucosamine synthase-like glycosyltransferase
MTSGACMIGRTSALRQILSRHSNWFPGEDIETGVIANHFRMRVRHVDFAVYTDVPETFLRWVNQRRMWWSGSFRMAFVNVDQTIRYPVTFFYTSGLVWLLCIAKWGELKNPAHVMYTLPFILLIYTGVCAASSWQVRSRWMIAFPYYSLFQVLVLPPLGLLFYLKLWWETRRLAPPGRYRIGFRALPLSLPVPGPAPARALAAVAAPVERRNLATRPWAMPEPTAQSRRPQLVSAAAGAVFEPRRATLGPRSGPLRLRPAARR